MKARMGMLGRKLGAVLAVAVTAALLLTAAGCGDSGSTSGGGVSGSIQVKGSDTMVNLAQKWAEDYMITNPQVNIAVTGGGSGTGITAMINGTTDIANSSREMKSKEKDESRAKGIEVEEHKVALDGIAVIVNPANKVTELSVEQLADIFSGKIKNWSEVGGEGGEIVVLSRESNSGTHVFFKEHILNGDKSDGTVEFGSATLLMPSSQAIYDEAAQNPQAIGYVGLGYVKEKVEALKIKKDAASPGVAPTVATVQSGEYPVSRPLFMYTKKGAPQLITDYVAWIKGPEGQKTVEELEFVPLAN